MNIQSYPPLEMMSMTDKIIKIVKKIGNDTSSDYSLLPWIIIIGSITIIIIYLVKIEVNMNGTNWEKNKCSSKYVFFSGLMKSGGMKETLKNFNECIVRFL
jgi:p-aminobenzoyl-glutamate transporter AbgT